MGVELELLLDGVVTGGCDELESPPFDGAEDELESPPPLEGADEELESPPPLEGAEDELGSPGLGADELCAGGVDDL